jgi:hypothetical protein
MAFYYMIVPPGCFASLYAACALVYAARRQRPFRTGIWKRYHWLFLTHALFFAAAAILGAASPTGPHQANPLASACWDAAFCGSFASCGFWIWRMRGFRWLASSLMVLIQIPTLGALFLAYLAITGFYI